MSKGLRLDKKKICVTGKWLIYMHTSSPAPSAHLWPNSSSVTEQLGVGLDVVGVYCECRRVELVRSLVVALLERLVPFFLLGFKCLGILPRQEAGYRIKCATINSNLGFDTLDGRVDLGTHPACEASLLVVRGHVQRVDEELDRLVDAVLIVKAKAADIQCVPISGVHSEDITAINQEERNYKDYKLDKKTLTSEVCGQVGLRGIIDWSGLFSPVILLKHHHSYRITLHMILALMIC